MKNKVLFIPLLIIFFVLFLLASIGIVDVFHIQELALKILIGGSSGIISVCCAYLCS